MRNHEIVRPSHEKSLLELSDTTSVCNVLKVKLERELHEIMDLSRGDADMHNEWRLSNRTGEHVSDARAI